MMRLRAFIAVGLPGELKGEIGKISSSLSIQIPGIRWVPPENIHLTLKFLGDVEQAIIPDIQTILDLLSARHLPITARFGELDAFPNRKRPRIIWLGVTEGSDHLIDLARDLSRGLTKLGFDPERKRFTPHLTLGRVKRGRITMELGDALGEDAEKTDKWLDSLGSLNINMLLLIKSTLTSQGAIHKIISQHGVAE